MNDVQTIAPALGIAV